MNYRILVSALAVVIFSVFIVPQVCAQQHTVLIGDYGKFVYGEHVDAPSGRRFSGLLEAEYRWINIMARGTNSNYRFDIKPPGITWYVVPYEEFLDVLKNNAREELYEKVSSPGDAIVLAITLFNPNTLDVEIYSYSVPNDRVFIHETFHCIGRQVGSWIGEESTDKYANMFMSSGEYKDWLLENH